MTPLDILMIVSEALPFSKSGGLGDVGGALPLALGRLGHRVTVVVPRYRGSGDGDDVMQLPIGSVPGARDVAIRERPMAPGVRAWLVDYPAYFDRGGFYGEGGVNYPDNDRRFALLALAALEGTARQGTRPDIVHSHDWQAGLALAYLATRYAGHPVLGGLPSVFTIHNLAYQGLFPRDVLPSLGLGWEVFTADGLEFWNRVSFLKAGINFASMVTTVSRKYAEEIQTPEQGAGFDGVLRKRASVLVGIRNGIDTDVWNPATDPHLPVSYGAGDLAGKRAARATLLERFGMTTAAQRARPLVGMVSRMVDQKGFDILARAADDLMGLGATFVVLGTGDSRYQELWRALARRFPDRVAATIGFDEALAHLIEGGADVFLMPSRFEPCGLNQMYSLRYGTVPVVRATGGLDDTITDVDPATGIGTGFKYGPQTTDAMLDALRRALAWYRRPEAWRRIQEAGMRQDYSWESAAREYVATYGRARALGPVATAGG